VDAAKYSSQMLTILTFMSARLPAAKEVKKWSSTHQSKVISAPTATKHLLRLLFSLTIMLCIIVVVRAGQSHDLTE